MQPRRINSAITLYTPTVMDTAKVISSIATPWMTSHMSDVMLAHAKGRHYSTELTGTERNSSVTLFYGTEQVQICMLSHT